MARKLRVAIDCGITDPRQGTGTAVLALAKALSGSGVTDQEYTFIVPEAICSWLAPYVHGPCQLQAIPSPKLHDVKSALRWIKPLRSMWRRIRAESNHVPASHGFVESGGFHVVHFPTQAAYLTALPTIYQPWDLQHLHYPEFFSKDEFALREKYYRAFCHQASFVCVQAEWTKQDIIRQYGIPEEKVTVIPWGSVFEAYQSPSAEEIRATTQKYSLPTQFFFYPAVTWPHKNHAVIFQALNFLKRDHGVAPLVFFTGASTDHRSVLMQLARDLNVSEQVHFLGFVTPTELQSIFTTATAMIFPSKFEGFGLPILEAFRAHLPVLSSNATTLPEIAQDGALYFNPDSPSELSALLWSVLQRSELRHEMIRKGLSIVSRYSIQDTAAKFQSLYSRTATLAFESHRLAGDSALN